MAGVIWNSPFIKWEDHRAFFNYSVGVLDPSKKYYMCLSYAGDVKVTWGLPRNQTSWSSTNRFVPGRKINDGGVTVRVDLRTPTCEGFTDDTKFIYVPKDPDIAPPPTPPPRECAVGETKCVGEDLYWCRDGIWALQQYGSPACKPPTPPPTPPPEPPAPPALCPRGLIYTRGLFQKCDPGYYQGDLPGAGIPGMGMACICAEGYEPPHIEPDVTGIAKLFEYIPLLIIAAIVVAALGMFKK